MKNEETHTSCQEQPEPWLTVNELMKKLQVSRTTIYRWTRMGILPAYRLPCSRNVYYRGSEVDSFIKQNPITPSGRLDKLGLGLFAAT